MMYYKLPGDEEGEEGSVLSVKQFCVSWKVEQPVLSGVCGLESRLRLDCSPAKEIN